MKAVSNMTTERQVLEACSGLKDLVEKSTPSADVVKEALRFVNKWRSERPPGQFTQAVTLFRVCLQMTVDGLKLQAPGIADREREAIATVFANEIIDISEGPVALLRKAIETYLSVIEALKAETNAHWAEYVNRRRPK